jgi:hypothetical protein
MSTPIPRLWPPEIVGKCNDGETRELCGGNLRYRFLAGTHMHLLADSASLRLHRRCLKGIRAGPATQLASLHEGHLQGAETLCEECTL